MASVSRTIASGRVCQPSLHRVAHFHRMRPVMPAVAAVSRSDLVAELAAKTGMKKKEAEESVSALLDIIVEKVASGEKVTVVGFGTFEAKQRSARQGRNPQTGESLQIPARTVPTFSAGKAFKTAVDAKPAAAATPAAEPVLKK